MSSCFICNTPPKGDMWRSIRRPGETSHGEYILPRTRMQLKAKSSTNSKLKPSRTALKDIVSTSMSVKPGRYQQRAKQQVRSQVFWKGENCEMETNSEESS
ncbi:hypothetical protein VTO42DRAFT_6073 [Malbranchea cinnamomea]